jgi:hypothetical protein
MSVDAPSVDKQMKHRGSSAARSSSLADEPMILE